MAYVQCVFKKHKPVKKTSSVEKREAAQASILRLLQEEQFAVEVKSLTAEKEIPKNSKILQFSPFIDQPGLIRAQGRIGKSQLNFEPSFTRAINVDELKRSEWLTGPAWLKQRENKWPEQLNLIFASDEQNDEMVFSAKVEEKKPMIQWERFSRFNRLVNTMAYVQRVFIKHKTATKTLSVEEREGAQASIFRLLKREQFAEEMKSLKAEKEGPKNSKILLFSPFIDQQVQFFAQGKIGKTLLNFETKHPIPLHWKHHVVELFLRNEHKYSHHRVLNMSEI